jgi:hypothetical protein
MSGVEVYKINQYGFPLKVPDLVERNRTPGKSSEETLEELGSQMTQKTRAEFHVRGDMCRRR